MLEVRRDAFVVYEDGTWTRTDFAGGLRPKFRWRYDGEILIKSPPYSSIWVRSNDCMSRYLREAILEMVELIAEKNLLGE
jgi:hypothetical protein